MTTTFLPDPPTVEQYVGRRELAVLMGVSTKTIDRWVRLGMPSETWGLRVRKFLPSQAKQWARSRGGPS